MTAQTPDYRELMARALAEIRTLRAQLADARTTADAPEGARDPIAVIGMGCRFPGGSEGPDAYWAMLREGVDAIREVPPGRWDAAGLQDPDREAPGRMINHVGGFIDDLEGFDAAFFGISPREAETMDPHQRVLLEVCWQALEHANLPPARLFGSDCGVFVGVSSMDNVIRLMGEDALSEIGAYHGTGCALAPIAGRVSYAFGFNGPSFVVDTACSSSLLSLHLAAASLRRRECGMALAGGVHLIFHPGYSVAFTKAHMLSPDGRCKTFDAAADGYVRGEGCGVLVLKRLEDARRDGDQVLAVLRGSAVNQDGASGGLTVPSGPSQEQVIRQALADAALPADAIDYIEAHGTGTSLGDPIEIGAIANVFGRRRLRVGSVKTNIGHLEASAGIASAIKVILALNREAIPPHLHLRTPNPLIPWGETGVEVPAALSPWPRDPGRERIAGISSFGFSGTNVHLLLGEAPSLEVTETRNEARQRPSLLCLSARSEPALRALATAWAEGPLADADPPFAELAAGALALRDPMPHRLALAATSVAQARERLGMFGAEGAGVVHAEAARAAPRPAFLFTGQGAQHAGMGRVLYDTEPVFRQTIDACEVILTPILGKSLRALMFEDQGDDAIHATGHTQPALFALEVALARWWIAIGVKPVALLGHSVGEYAAAVIAGVFTLEDGARMIAARARLMQALPTGGAMAAVLAPEARVRAALEASVHRDRLAIAAINGPANTVLSGDADALDALCEALSAESIGSRRLTVSHAFHSARMDPMLEAFREVAATVRYAKPTIPVVSNLTGRAAGDEIASPDYWVRHAREAVRFADGVADLRRLGCNWLLEVGPTGTLVAMARQVDPELPGKASQRPGEDAQGALFDALGDYWCRGGAPDAIIAAGAVGPIRRDLTLPVYPFRHRRYWKSVGAGARAVGWHGVARLDMELLTARLRSPALREDLFETVFSRNRLPWLDDHRIFGAQVVSGASHLSLVLAALAQRAGVPGGSLRDVLFPAALVLPEDAERVTHLAIAPLSASERDGAGDASETFRLVSLPDGGETKEPVLHCRGLIGLVPPSSAAIDVHAVWEAGGEPVEPEAVYALQQQRHIVLGPSYRWIDALRRAPGVALARLRAPAPVMPTLARHALHPGLIDACFGVLVTAGTSADSPDAGESFIPFAAQAVHWHRSVGEGALFAVARVRIQDAQRLVGDITLHDAQGESVAEFIGLEGRRAARHALLRDAEHAPLPACSVAWEPVDPVIRPPSGRWLVLADAQGVGDALVAALRDTGLDTFVAHADRGANALRRPSRDAFALAPASSAAFIELIAACGPLDHVVNLWALDGDPSEMTSLFGDLSAGVLHLSQALAGARPGPATRLWLATRGAQAVREGDRVPAPWQAIVWGMARAIGAEGAVPACACLDLDPDAPPGQAVPAMLRAACLPVAEDRIAWRGGRLQVARLVQTSATPSAEPEWPQDRSQVITGAGGALGRALAQWLAARGVRHLALLSRTPPDAAFLDTLRASGAQPRAWAVDVADAAALARVLASVAAEQAPVGRIFHLAGLLDDRSVASQTAERCAAVLAPKALGAWHLHLHAVSEPDASPDWVVFSSVAGWLDAPGQLAYAAANAFLDALAAHRRAAGLPALSLAWGPWAEIGMAARMSPAAQAGLAARGFAPIDPDRGWRTLGTLLTAPRDAASVALVDADWLRHAGARPSAFLLRVAQADAPAIAAQGRGALRERLTAMAAPERGALIRAELIGLVAAVLRLPRSEVGPRVRLFDLGVDSLTALELKRHLEGLLGLTLSSTLLFDFPSIDALTRHLLDEALPASGFAAGATTDPRPDAPAATDVVAGAQDAVAALTEDEAEAELLARLSAFETPGDRQA